MPPTVLQRVTNVTEPARAMADTMTEMGNNTRLNLARGLSAGATHVSTMDGQEIVMSASQVATLAKAASIVHDWPKSVQLNVLTDVLSGDSVALPDDVIDI